MCCKTGESMMDTSNTKPKKLFFLFVVICSIAIMIIVISGISFSSRDKAIAAPAAENMNFDNDGQVIYDTYDDTTAIYMEGNSTSRTLNYYYSLRQYPGSPPYIVHDLKDSKGEAYECLSCHGKGGFTQSMNRYAPVTPHPQQSYCQQCHVKPATDQLFRESDWLSVATPILGRSFLPGSPPPVVHSLQMRENCVACHVGPGSVATIRVEHPMRGNCKQCHVPEVVNDLFKSKYDK